MTGLRAVSYGGGVQSTALLVLAAQGHIDYPLFIFANVGDDSEHPGTLAYLRDHAEPFAAEHGIELVSRRRVLSDGRRETLLEEVMNDRLGAIPIPIRAANGAPMRRQCTGDYKVDVVRKELRARGATHKNPAIVAVGISTDELKRAGTVRRVRYEIRSYPLIDLGLSRGNCEAVITSAGLPLPGKSACYFCPFHRPQVWAEMRRDEPDLFDKAAGVERAVIAKRAAAGQQPAYLSRFGRPLGEAIGVAQDALSFDPHDDGCDGEVCFT